MVVGHVQSGKTANYSALICKAADSGYKFIVVIAGAMNNLRNQTQIRVQNALINPNSPSTKPDFLTSETEDLGKKFTKQRAKGGNLDTSITPIVLVIKKNVSSLNNVIEWLDKSYKGKIENHAMLLIDDEADYASVDTKKKNKTEDDKDHDPTSINKSIRRLINTFKKSTYVGYTATPYANIFIDHQENHNELGADLFPHDFIYSLNAPDNYMGLKWFFEELPNPFIRYIEESEFDDMDFSPLKHKKDEQLKTLPPSLIEAIHQFVINVAVRDLRGQTDKHNSMLIHMSLFTNVHKSIAYLVGGYLDKLKADIISFGSLDTPEGFSGHISKIKNLYETSSMEFSWNEVIHKIQETIKTIQVCDVHSESQVELSYDDDRKNVIAIGGLSLARGFTLEGLSVSYFMRNTVMNDTLMQMGRWFGYRNGYDDLCKLYITEKKATHFQDIFLTAEDLVDQLKDMKLKGLTPRDYGIAVRQHPESVLQVTALNKSRDSQDILVDMDLSGRAKETSWIVKSPKSLQDNLQLAYDFVNKVDTSYYRESVKSSYLWRNVEKDIVLEFASNAKIYDPHGHGLGIRTRMPIAFIKQFIHDSDVKWDVALYSGDKANELYSFGNDINIYKESRKFVEHEDYYEVSNRQVSSGSAEAIALPSKALRDEVGSNRSKARKLRKNPLLMLHILQPSNLPDGPEELLAFGFSFSGDVGDKYNIVKRKYNTVAINELINQDMNDDEN